MHVYLDLFVLLFAYFYVQYASKMLYELFLFYFLKSIPKNYRTILKQKPVITTLLKLVTSNLRS